MFKVRHIVALHQPNASDDYANPPPVTSHAGSGTAPSAGADFRPLNAEIVTVGLIGGSSNCSCNARGVTHEAEVAGLPPDTNADAIGTSECMSWAKITNRYNSAA